MTSTSAPAHVSTTIRRHLVRDLTTTLYACAILSCACWAGSNALTALWYGAFPSVHTLSRIPLAVMVALAVLLAASGAMLDILTRDDYPEPWLARIRRRLPIIGPIALAEEREEALLRLAAGDAAHLRSCARDPISAELLDRVGSAITRDVPVALALRLAPDIFPTELRERLACASVNHATLQVALFAEAAAAGRSLQALTSRIVADFGTLRTILILAPVALVVVAIIVDALPHVVATLGVVLSPVAFATLHDCSRPPIPPDA